MPTHDPPHARPLQYGEGSGAAFGFSAGSNSSALANTPTLEYFRALLGLQPLPDVFSWSWGSMDMTLAQAPFQVGSSACCACCACSAGCAGLLAGRQQAAMTGCDE